MDSTSLYILVTCNSAKPPTCCKYARRLDFAPVLDGIGMSAAYFCSCPLLWVTDLAFMFDQVYCSTAILNRPLSMFIAVLARTVAKDPKVQTSCKVGIKIARDTRT